MPSINVNGRYCLFPYVGASSSTTFRDSTYVNNICSVSTPNPLGFSLYLPYIPGLTQPNQGLTTIAPGSSYQIISREDGVKWSLTYPGSDVDRLPAAINVKTPLFMIGLDKNSIVVPISSYVLGVNSPLSSIGQMRLTNGTYASINQFNAADVKNGLYFGDTHFRPNSAYRLRNRVPFTFFAPLQSEMGDAWATGANDKGQLGMGYQYSSDVGYTQLYGNWDKVVMSLTHAAALSACGTKKKLFVCGQNDYGQLGLTPVVNYTLQPTLTATQTVWKELQNIWTWVWDDNGETYYYRNILDSENILDVEVADDFTLIKTDVQLYGCGRMSNMGLAAPGADYAGEYQFQDARGNSFTNYHIPYFTSFLERNTPTFFFYAYGADFTLYNQIPSSSVKKFQARGARWFYLNTDGRLYGQGKLGSSSTVTSNSPICIPVGVSDQRTASSGIQGYLSTRQLYGPGNPSTRYYEQFYNDFESNLTCIAALSSDLKTWLVHGPTNFSSSGTAAQKAGNPSLSTICFFDPNQNAYVPQNDYFLRVYPSWNGFMAIYNGKLYFTPNGAFVNVGLDAGGVNGAGTSIISRLPASTLPILNNALGANPAEKANLRTLVPLTYMGQPDINWKSLFTAFTYSAAIDVNNKLYVTGFNSIIASSIDAKSLLGFPSATSNIYTFTKVNEENIYNTNSNYANLVVYKTNRNPAPSPTPIPSPTPTPSPTPAVVYPQANGARIMITCANSNAEFATNGIGNWICLMDSDDCDNWVCRNTAFDNRPSYKQVGLFYNYNPSPGRGISAETLYLLFPPFGACIPTNLPGNPYKTLLVFQSFFQNPPGSPTERTGYLNIGTSVNNTISQNPAGSSGVTWTRYINPIPCIEPSTSPIEPRFGCNNSSNGGLLATDCFWDPNNSAGPRMYVLFSRFSSGLTNNLNGHIIDPINPLYSNNSISIIPDQIVDSGISSVTAPGGVPASERICRSASNGYIYCAAFLVAGGGKILRIVYYDRNKINEYPSGWNTLPDVPNIPGVSVNTPSNTDGVGYDRKAKIIRVSFFNNGDAVLCYVIPRDQISSNANFRVSNPYSDLYMQFYRKNTNSWTTPTIIKGNLIVRGIWVVSSDNNPNAWFQPSTFAPYDITVNPLTQQIHLIFNQDTGSIGCNQRIYSAIFNQQGTQIGSDTEVFNPATASGQTYGFAGDIELFYKSTNANEFIPYFKAQTNATTSLTPQTPSRLYANTSVFKFNGTTYVKIFTPSIPATGSFVGFYKSAGTGTTTRDSWSRSAMHKVFQ
jgi:hypothetical protein